MKQEDIIAGYLLEMSKHQCSTRRIWLGKEIYSNKKVIISTSILRDKLSFADLRPISEKESQANRQLSLPIRVFKEHFKNNVYLVQVKQYYQEENLRRWINKNKKEEKKVNGKQGYIEQIGLFQKIIIQIKRINDLKFEIKDLKIQKILIGKDRVRILGGWYHYQYDEKTNMIKLRANGLSRDQLHLMMLQTMRDVIKIGISVISKKILNNRSQKRQILKFVKQQINDNNLKKKFSSLIQKYYQQYSNFSQSQIKNLYQKLIQHFKQQDNQLQSSQDQYLDEINIQTHKKISIALSLKVKNENQNKITVTKWQSTFRVQRGKDVIDLMYTKRSMIEYLGIRVSDQRQSQKQSIIYTFDWLPQKMKDIVQSINQLYNILFDEKDDLIIIDNYLVNGGSQLILEQSQLTPEQKAVNITLHKQQSLFQLSSEENYSQNVIHSQNEIQLYQIKLKPIKFYCIDREDLKPNVQNEQFINKLERVSIQKLLQLQIKLLSLHSINSHNYSENLDCQRLQWLGVQYFQQGNLLKAIQLFRLAFSKCQTYQQLPDQRRISLLYNFALYYQKIERFQESIIYCFQSLQLSINNSGYINFTLQSMNLLINLLTYHFGDYDEALYYIGQAKDLLKNISSIEGARFLNTIGIVMLQLSQYKDAIEYFLKALRVYEKIEAKNLEEIGLCQLNLSNAYSYALQYQQTLQFLSRSGEKLEKNKLWEGQVLKVMVRLVRNCIKDECEGQVKRSLSIFVQRQQLNKLNNFPLPLLNYFKK